MKHFKFCMYLWACILIYTPAFALQSDGPTGPGGPATGAGNLPMGPSGAMSVPTPAQPHPSGGPSGLVPGHGGPEPLYFAAGAVSPDGKNMYVAFDRYLMCYSLPALKQVRKVDIGLPAVPMTPSISLSSDGKWIYIVQNGTIFQVEKETFKIKTSEKLHP